MIFVKLKNEYLDPIDSKLGLKQGCPLSPLLFNLYIDGIENIFDDQCDPIDFQNVLVLLSHTCEGS